MINDNENEAENKKRSQRYNINWPRLSLMMLLCIKQHLSNIWSSVHEKVKQHWSWTETKQCLLKKSF